LRRDAHREEIKQALWQGFQETWGIELHKAELTDEEIKLKDRFLSTRYRRDSIFAGDIS